MTDQLELPESNFSRIEVKMAYVAVLITLFTIAFIPILVRISESSISPNATIFNRCWIATVLLGLWNGLSLLKRRCSGNSIPVKLFPDNNNLLLLLLMLGVFYGAQQLFYVRSLTQTSVANSEVLHSLTPLFTTLVGWTFLGQRFERRFLMGIAIAIGGSIALVANDFSITIDKLQGDGLALVSALFWGGYLMVVEKLQTQLSIRAIATWESLLSTIFLLPILPIARWREVFPHSARGWLTVAALGIGVIIAIASIAISLKRLSSGLVATILLLHPVITAILAWGIFSETLNWLNFLAFVVILLGAYLTISSKGGVKATEE
ncbi:MAG: DMT family transporter [Microcoleaceae cyanobacterium]